MATEVVVCTACGYHGAKRGYGCAQIGILLFLALFFLIPGLLYAMYVDSWAKRCPSCDQKMLVPSESPRGKEMMARFPANEKPPAPAAGLPPRPPATAVAILVALVCLGLIGILFAIRSRTPEAAAPLQETKAAASTATRTATAGTASERQYVMIREEPTVTTPQEVATESSQPEAAPVAVVQQTQTQKILGFESQRESFSQHARYFLDARNAVYNAEGCPQVTPAMARGVKAAATLKGYTAHSCVK